MDFDMFGCYRVEFIVTLELIYLKLGFCRFWF